MRRSTPTPDSTTAPTTPAPRQGGVLTIIADGPTPYTSRLTPSAPYLFMHHPTHWAVVRGSLRPTLGQLSCSPGVNGVSIRKVGDRVGFDLRDAIRDMNRKGFTVIPHDVDGPGTSYLWEPQPGCFLSRWQRPIPDSDATVVDEAGFWTWTTSLVERGVISPVRFDIAAKLVEKYEADLVRATDDARDGQPSLVARRDAVAADLEVVRAEHRAAEERYRQGIGPAGFVFAPASGATS